MKDAPLFPFGHGLSYTTFAYAGINLSKTRITVGSSVEISVDFTNTGRIHGDDVAQLYVRDVECSVVRPAKELRGFQRITHEDRRTTTAARLFPPACAATAPNSRGRICFPEQTPPVAVNGRPVATLWGAPCRTDITP